MLAQVLEAILEAGRRAQMTVTGTSMGRTLRSGDRVTVAPCAPDDARIGDLLLYRREDGGLALHRLVRRGEGWLQTGGDGCWRLDARWPPEALLGRAVEIERDGRPCPRAGSLLARTIAAALLLRGIACARLGAREPAERQPLRRAWRRA